MTVTIEVFDHIRSNDPIERIEFDNPCDAREFMFNQDNLWTPMDMVRGCTTVCRNYPNVYAGTIASREKAEALWLAKDSSWESYDFTY